MQMTDKEWKEKIESFQYYVLREKGTEKPFSGEFVFTKRQRYLQVRWLW